MADVEDEDQPPPPEFHIDLGITDDEPGVITMRVVVRLKPHAAAQLINSLRGALSTIVNEQRRIIRPN